MNALTHYLDQQAATKAGRQAAEAGVASNPDRFITTRTGKAPAPLPPNTELERVVAFQEEDILRTKVRAFEEDLTIYATPRIYLLATGGLIGIDTASNVSVMLDMGYTPMLAILLGMMLTCTVIALIAGVIE
jgi:hypothetical protein